MEELIPGTVDASLEKHVPVVTRLDDCHIKVEVGSVAHPMLPEHHIAFIYVETENGGIRVDLKDKPEAVVCVCNEKPVAVYEYCNLHGLWKTDVVEAPVCDLKPVDRNATEDYVVCKCNNVTSFDILDEVEKHRDINELLDMFENVKNTTHCSTGCGGCYDKVIAIISDAMAK